MKRNLSIAVAFVIICSIVSGYVYAEPVTASNFKDIKNTDWYAEAVVRLNKSDIINGLSGGLFNPKGEVTRAQFTKMLVQAMGYKKIDSISFDDIRPLEKGKAHWASVYIETALRNGVIIKDEIGDKFYPEVPIKREDMFTMMFRALKLATSEGDNPFYDIAESNGEFTRLYEEYLVRGVVDGNRRLFMPQSLSTRAEAAVVIDRMLEYRDDPAGFVAKAGMKERFENGTQTAEDIVLKRQIEIKRAKADLNYIMEPEIRILNTRADFDGYGDIADISFKIHAGYIAMGNYEDFYKYAPDTQVKVVCTDKDKDLINTGTLLTKPFKSYDHVYEVRRDVWEPIKRAYDKELNAYVLRAITRDEEKAVNGKWTNVTEYNKKGEILNFKIYLKRGSDTQEHNIKFEIN